MQALKFPFRVGRDGHIDTATTYAEIVRGHLIDALMTNFRERVMRPSYGSDVQSALFDPTDTLVRSDAASVVTERVTYCAPRVILESVGFAEDVTQPTSLFLQVSYRVGLFDQTQQLKMPVSAFLSEESEI